MTTTKTREPMCDTLAVLAALVAAGAVETLQRMLDLAREPKAKQILRLALVHASRARSRN